MNMKIELHLHTLRHSACATEQPEEILPKLIKAKYGAVFLTEHDAVWDERELSGLRNRFPEILIFPGVELTVGIQSMQHLLVLGTTDPEYIMLRDGRFILKKAREEGCLTVLAHPFRWEDSADMIWGGQLPDAIELRTGNHNEEMALQSEEIARRLNLRLVNAGDVHAGSMIGKFWIETPATIKNAWDVRDAIVRGDYKNCQAKTKK
jgi:predicted metal-dependent phosphoesterase TrpH